MHEDQNIKGIADLKKLVNLISSDMETSVIILMYCTCT